MNDPSQLAPPVFTGQRVEDVVRRLHVVSCFATLTGPHALLALEMERDFVFGMMSEARANECRALYNFIFDRTDFPTEASAVGQREQDPQGNPQ